MIRRIQYVDREIGFSKLNADIADKTLTITLMSGDVVEATGVMVSKDSTSGNLSDGHVISVRTDDIRLLRHRQKSKTLQGVGLGGGIGALAGFIIGAAEGSRPGALGSAEEIGLVGAILRGVTGALIGGIAAPAGHRTDYVFRTEEYVPPRLSLSAAFGSTNKGSVSGYDGKSNLDLQHSLQVYEVEVHFRKMPGFGSGILELGAGTGLYRADIRRVFSPTQRTNTTRPGMIASLVFRPVDRRFFLEGRVKYRLIPTWSTHLNWTRTVSPWQDPDLSEPTTETVTTALDNIRLGGFAWSIGLGVRI